MKTHRYGWRRDHLNPNHPIATTQRTQDALSVDLRAQCPPVYDQGTTSSCTANALCGNVEFLLMRLGHVAATPSRMFVYALERRLEGTLMSDAGAEPQSGVRVLQADGAPPEDDWRFSPNNLFTMPSYSVMATAKRTKVSEAYKLAPGLDAMRWSLRCGWPFSFGALVYDDLESADVARTGAVPTPDKTQEPAGGHYMMAVGCDDASRKFIVRNSWGSHWGMAGYCLLDYAYLGDPDLVSDAWTLRALAVA